jgi:hypothetical protein
VLQVFISAGDIMDYPEIPDSDKYLRSLRLYFFANSA